MVDKHLKQDESSPCINSLRKFPSIFDLVYTLFDNKNVYEKIKYMMDNIDVKQRDGYQYTDHLNNISEKYEKMEFANTIYAQELKMLRALVADKKILSDKCIHPFDTNSWNLKQAQTQIGFYTEIRHDNVLYNDEVCGLRDSCMYPDLMVEPCPTFWNEFLVLIKMLRSLVKNNDMINIKILDGFENVIKKFIVFVDQYLNNKKIDEKIVEELKCIVQEKHFGSGSVSYEGWYMKLFHDPESSMMFKPEIASMFTGLDDLRGNGGIVHIGTGPVQVMYVTITNPITNEKVLYMGPTYSTYEIITPCDKRLNDSEWMKQYENYKPINLSE